MHTLTRRVPSLAILNIPAIIVVNGMLFLSRGGRAFQHHAHNSQVLLHGLRAEQQAVNSAALLTRTSPAPLMISRASFSSLSMSWDDGSGHREYRGGGGRRPNVDRGFSNPRQTAGAGDGSHRSIGGGPRPARKSKLDKSYDVEPMNNGGGNPRQGWGESSDGGDGRGGRQTERRAGGRGGGNGDRDADRRGFRERSGRGGGDGGGANGSSRESGAQRWLAADQEARDRHRNSNERNFGDSDRSHGADREGGGGRGSVREFEQEERIGRSSRDFGDRRARGGDDQQERAGRAPRGTGRGRNGRGEDSRGRGRGDRGDRSGTDSRAARGGRGDRAGGGSNSITERGAGSRGSRGYEERRPQESRGGPRRERGGLDDVLQRYRQGELDADTGARDDSASSRNDDEAGEPAEKPASDWMRGELADYQAELAPRAISMEEDTDFDMLYGIAPVLNALQNDRRELLGLYCQDGLAPANKKDRSAANKIYDLARENDVMMTTSDKGYLNTLSGNRPHQGFILKARKLEFEPILFLPPVSDGNEAATANTANTPSKKKGKKATRTQTQSGIDQENDGGEETEDTGAVAKGDIVAAAGMVWLALDEVTDPQNFGALLRSAHFFGASGVVTCAKNSASLTSTVTKASAGAAEVMRVHSTANMMRFLKRSRENGWRIVGTSVSERSVTLHELPAGPDVPPTIVVLGNEGYGVRASVLRECEVLVEVPGDGGGALAAGAKMSTVDSLNVSVTGGVMLYHLLAGAKDGAAVNSAAAAGQGEAVASDATAPEAAVEERGGEEDEVAREKEDVGGEGEGRGVPGATVDTEPATSAPFSFGRGAF